MKDKGVKIDFLISINKIVVNNVDIINVSIVLYILIIIKI